MQRLPTNKLFEMDVSEEAEIVSRVLLAVHRAVDENFPSAANASARFSRTVFSDMPDEDTVADRLPTPPKGVADAAAVTKEAVPVRGKHGESKGVLENTAYIPPPSPRTSPSPAARKPEAASAFSRLDDALSKNPSSGQLSLSAMETLSKDKNRGLRIFLLIVLFTAVGAFTALWILKSSF